MMPRGRRCAVAAAVLTLLINTGCQGEEPPRVSHAGQGELLASGEAWGKDWQIHCGIDLSAGPGRFGFDAAAPRSCADGGDPFPCIHVDFASSSLIRCQLETLPKRLIISHSIETTGDRFLFAGATDPSVARLVFALKDDGQVAADLISSALARFKVFALEVTGERLRRFERPILFDEAGKVIDEAGAQ
jgi:hypothetical protein